jgi:hypothetical protein
MEFTMDYKKVFGSVMFLLKHPAMAWRLVSHEDSVNAMFGNYLYPLVMLCGTSVLLGRIFTNGIGWDTLYASLINAALCSVSMLVAYYALSFLLHIFTVKYTGVEYQRETVNLFTGYSMVVVLVLNICLGLFPDLRLLAFIAQFYTLKIVWDGASVLMKINEERRLLYVVIVSVAVMAMPFLIGRLLGFLSVVLN